MSSPSRILRIARASAHSTCGWLAYRLGWQRTAHRQFEKVLMLRGADFRAYVHLGRIAFDQGDYASWRREFEHARRTDPVKFARLRHPMELFEPRLAGTQFDGRHERNGFHATNARATWRALHPFGPNPMGPDSMGPGSVGPGSVGPGSAGPDALHFGSAGQDFGGLGTTGTEATGTGTAGGPPGSGVEDHRRPEGFGHSTDLPLAPGFDPLGFDPLSIESTSPDSSSPSNESLRDKLDDLMAGGTADGEDLHDAGVRDGNGPGGNGPGDKPDPTSGDRPSVPPTPVPPTPVPPTPSMPDALLTRDDFASAAERRRFQLRRPIDVQEIARCDVNDLARRLSS